MGCLSQSGVGLPEQRQEYMEAGGRLQGGPPTSSARIGPRGSQVVPQAAVSTARLLPQPDADPWAPSALGTQPGRVGVLEMLVQEDPKRARYEGIPLL